MAQRVRITGTACLSWNLLVAEIKALRSPALLVAVDQEGGPVQRFTEGFRELPAAGRLSQLYNRDRAFHRDPVSICELAGAYITGMNRAGAAVDTGGEKRRDAGSRLRHGAGV